MLADVDQRFDGQLVSIRVLETFLLCTVPEHLVCVLKKIFDSKLFANLLILRKVMEHTEQLLPTRTKGGFA